MSKCTEIISLDGNVVNVSSFTTDETSELGSLSIDETSALGSLSIASTIEQGKAKRREEGKRRAKEIAIARKNKEEADTSTKDHNGHGAHNSVKALRFVKWILSTFDHLPLSVVDVAAGTGEVAVRLNFCHQVPSWTVDVRGHENLHFDTLEKKIIKKLPKKWQEKLISLSPEELRERAESKMPVQIIERFDSLSQVEKNPTLMSAMRGASLLLGLHADASTEPIVDFAIKYNKAFAVVPCCVFPNLFKQRRTDEGREVRSTDDFIRYLQVVRGGGRFDKETLNFPGKNQVVFWKGKETVIEKVLGKVKDGECAIVKWKGQGGDPTFPELEEETRGVGTVAFFEDEGGRGGGMLEEAVKRVKQTRAIDVGLLVTRERTEFVPEWVDWFVCVGGENSERFADVVSIKEWGGGNGEIWTANKAKGGG